MDATDNTDFPADLQIENLFQLSDEQLKRGRCTKRGGSTNRQDAKSAKKEFF